jgi:hypothetical protein
MDLKLMKSRGGAPTRRHFLIALGAGVTASIAGYFVLRQRPPQNQPTRGAAAAQPECPQLASDIQLQPDGQDYLIVGAEAAVLGAVNNAGYEIMQRLDGRHTVQDIMASLARITGVQESEQLAGKVAGFVAQLGAMGHLQHPYYVTLIEQKAT